MNQLSTIKSKLSNIDSTTFQELCDAFLSIRHRDYKAFSRSGAHDIKKKTTVGTPDSLFLLPNGRYLFVESTTVEDKAKGLINKLKKDVISCFNKAEKESIKIQEIILCFNSNLKISALEEINTITKEKISQVPDYYNLDRLANDIFLHHKNLAHDFLDVELDTGQVVSLKKFIINYDNEKQKLATPLNNPFLLRQKEQDEFQGKIADEDIVILSGAAGVGKSKLAIEGIESFLKKNLDYNAYAISPKGANLLRDLGAYFNGAEKSILLVDDVNRVDKFQQILGFYQGVEKGKLKLILTVRDYALDNVKENVALYKSSVMKIQEFKYEEVIDIIIQEPFKTPHYFHHKIATIAKGNIRLAVMLALIAKEKGNLDALHNVADVFDQYFETFTSDDGAFKESINLKTIGILSFFYNIPYNDKEVLDSITSTFKISADDFKQSLDRLHELDFLQLRYDYARIAEQNLSTYFFYKVFIKDQLLSFEELFFNFYTKQEGRFVDSVEPAIKNFDEEFILKQIKPTLKKYWNTLGEKEEAKLQFLNFSCTYLPDESFDYLENIIKVYPEAASATLTTKYDTNELASKQNKYLKLLSKFYKTEEYLVDSLDLSFEYLLRFPEHLSEFIYNLHECIGFSETDRIEFFKRQESLSNFLIQETNKGELFVKTFLAVSAKMVNHLRWTYENSEESEEDSPNIIAVKKIRTEILNEVSRLFENYSNDVLQFLIDLSTGINNENYHTFLFDLEYIIPIIDKDFNESSFKHCFYVQELIRAAKREKVNHKDFARLKEKYKHKTYNIFQLLNWDRRRMKEDYDYKDSSKFEKLKEQDISKGLVFKSKKEVDEFLENFEEILCWKVIQLHSQEKSIELINKYNLLESQEIGFYTFVELAKFCRRIKSSSQLYFTYKAIENLTKSVELTERFWNLIDKEKLGYGWRLELLLCLESENIEEVHLTRLYNSLERIDENYLIDHKRLDRFEKLDANVYLKIFELATNRNKKKDVKILLYAEFFEQVSLQKIDLKVIKSAYLQQDTLRIHFDYNGKALLSIVKRDELFLLEYLKGIFDSDKTEKAKDYREFSIIWQLPNATELLDKAIEFMASYKTYFTLGDHFANAFFEKAYNNPEQVTDYLKRVIREKSDDSETMKIVFNVIYHSVHSFSDEAFNHYIKNNQDLESFKKIKWWKDQVLYSGGTIVGDVRAAKWQKLLERVESANINSKTRAIRRYIKQRKDQELEYGESERKRNFLRSF